jgi:hypothetical protein
MLVMLKMCFSLVRWYKPIVRALFLDLRTSLAQHDCSSWIAILVEYRAAASNPGLGSALLLRWLSYKVI